MVIVKNQTGRGARAADLRPHKKVYTFNFFSYRQQNPDETRPKSRC